MVLGTVYPGGTVCIVQNIEGYGNTFKFYFCMILSKPLISELLSGNGTI